ncbi:MAG: RHE_PE00001 family protein [Rhizobiaceae bacterium]|nr:RHE_PE00001 family protein [Rhizobiaceae bacterium]MCZ8352862.1 RHE_PE00001 family protein [Rhizobium sp.]
MSYDLTKLPIRSLLRPISEAAVALARLYERIARSTVGEGFLERSHFLEAHASLWVDGELVHLEDLVLHDPLRDLRAPTHELTIARDILKTRRRISAHPPAWALSAQGLASLRGRAWPAASLGEDGEGVPDGNVEVSDARVWVGEAEDPHNDGLGDAFAAIDAVLARSGAAIEEAKRPRRAKNAPERDPFVYDLDWDEDERLEEWQAVLARSQDLPPVLLAIVALDVWNEIAVLQNAPWLGRLLAASILREGAVTSGGHLVAINSGLKAIPVDRRRHRDRETRLLVVLRALTIAAETGLQEHDRLVLARQMMMRKLEGRRTSSRLPELVELVMARPLISAGMVAKTLEVTPQGARRIVQELGLREMTGRGRFRAWGVL